MLSSVLSVLSVDELDHPSLPLVLKTHLLLSYIMHTVKYSPIERAFHTQVNARNPANGIVVRKIVITIQLFIKHICIVKLS